MKNQQQKGINKMKILIGNVILNIELIDRVEIVERFGRVIIPKKRFDIDVYYKTLLPRKRMLDPQNFEIEFSTVMSFQGKNAKENAESLLKSTYEIIFKETEPINHDF